jgi:cysteine-rich repeat protein
VHETEGCDDENTAPGDGCSEQCTVESGFTCEGAPSVCADVDECMEDLDNCDPNALCTNTAGGFTCACKEGYFGDGLLCTLIECADGDVGQAAPGPSCDGLAPTCGAAHDESCCTSQIVPGNAVGGACEGQPFFLDYDAAAGNYDTKNAPATVSNYAIDKFEVTVGRFRKFVEAYDQWHVVEKHPLPGEGAHPRVTNAPTAWDPAWDEAVCPGDTGKKPCLPIDAADFRSATRINPVQNNKQNTWTNEPDIHENRPINYVNWFEAYAFCLWDGGWLPTSSEWMYAAAGGTQQRSYPWSVPPTSTTINGTYASYTQNSTYTGCGKPSNAFVIGCIIEVGTKPLGVGRWLHMDMGGNLSEWNVDWYKPTYTTPCDNCVQSVVGTQRAHRGSDIYDGPALLRVPRQNFNEPYKRGIDIGFRCARLP